MLPNIGDGWSLRDYDADTFGPLLGVSDDGDAVEVVVRAALDSPKSRVLRRRGALSIRTVGLCIDAERMDAAGELPVGPEEYTRIRERLRGRAPLTTNVGTVVLPRYLRPPPTINVRVGRRADALVTQGCIEELRQAFAPFLHTPDGEARPIVVYVNFYAGDRTSVRRKGRILAELAQAVRSGDFANPDCHGIGLLQRVEDSDGTAAIVGIDIAAAAGVGSVAIEGRALYESVDQLTRPGLLSVFTEEGADRALQRATAQGIDVHPKNRLDTETAARTIWAGLNSARTMGAHLGKYGLHPLTFEEQLACVARVNAWLPDWTAAPAFYVDRPLVTRSGITPEHELARAIADWLRTVAALKVPVVLIDAPNRTPSPAGVSTTPWDRDRGRRLLKRDGDALGVLDPHGAVEIQHVAQELGTRVLWAGGVNHREAYELAKAGAFGVFTTSSTARRVAVRDVDADPASYSELEPTYFGVLCVRMLLEAGFLLNQLSSRADQETSADLASAADALLESVAELQIFDDGTDPPIVVTALERLLTAEWDRHFDRVGVPR